MPKCMKCKRFFVCSDSIICSKKSEMDYECICDSCNSKQGGSMHGTVYVGVKERKGNFIGGTQIFQ